MEIINQIYQTTDYSKFKILLGNRNLDKLQVKRLKESFKRSYLTTPIIVNENFEIIDGQHRFEAAKSLNLPIYYFINPKYRLEEVQILNENMKNWNKKDYLNAYCDMKYTEYLKFRNFMREFPDFGIDACESLLNNTASNNSAQGYDKNLISETNKSGVYRKRNFHSGELCIENYDLAVENAKKIMMIKPYYNGFNRAGFVKTMIGMFKNENYNHDKFISKLKKGTKSLHNCSSINDYKVLIEDIFNYCSQIKVSLRY